MDMALRDNMGRLSESERKLYKYISGAWTAATLNLPRQDLPFTRSSVAQTEPEHAATFYCMLEEKVDKLLDTLTKSCDGESNNEDPLIDEKYQTLAEMRTEREILLTQVSMTTSVATKVINETRGKYQKEFVDSFSSALLAKAGGDSAMVDYLDTLSKVSASKPSPELDKLRDKMQSLLQQRSELQGEISQLQSKLDAYKSNESEYDKLIERYDDYRSQLEVRRPFMVDFAGAMSRKSSRRRSRSVSSVRFR